VPVATTLSVAVPPPAMDVLAGWVVIAGLVLVLESAFKYNVVINSVFTEATPVSICTGVY
jgi:hypothetical protein